MEQALPQDGRGSVWLSGAWLSGGCAYVRAMMVVCGVGTLQLRTLS